MSMPISLLGRLALPAIVAPMFLVSTVELVLACCRAGVVGSFPSLNARPASVLEDWLRRLTSSLTAEDAPFAVNLIVHRSNARLEEDLALVVKYRVPVVITSLGARPEVNDAVHAYGGIVLHDVTTDAFARKAVARGADGLIAVAAGAGGHAGTQSPFALVQEIRAWFDGPLALSGAIASGQAIVAARALGADLAYIGSAFIATEEAAADPRYKQMVVESSAEDIVYSNLFTGVHGNYLAASIRAAGLDPADLALSDPSRMDVSTFSGGTKAWRDIWGAGQGIGAVDAVVPAAELIARLQQEYRDTLSLLAEESRLLNGDDPNPGG
ncbi:NAD(P)H-dependent flavin oxidoreductase [Gluconacetobacter liquefaciens]|uniref:Nitronate monooxygenase n=1 Tax=Gluconacetobacter liquefaciens TaxID=89584 RepID=A0A370G9V1_GLULI|nr:nitronate monooxygenase family protein [Gluconacetobacter liquefaciens]MBB2185981.1 nitronate monooxygenase [Gluconacetobacter liquefaciens]RDI39799.1 nitronate monooxygenase [Gluconacetobacter liquefaciens]